MYKEKYNKQIRNSSNTVTHVDKSKWGRELLENFKKLLFDFILHTLFHVLNTVSLAFSFSHTLTHTKEEFIPRKCVKLTHIV